MASSRPFFRTLWPLLVLPLAFSLLGLECQYEPLPDERRGYLGDLCRPNGTCEPCRTSDGGDCSPRLLCAQDSNGTPRCLAECALSTASDSCGSCGPTARCEAVRLADGGTTQGVGACVTAPEEGGDCSADRRCAGCLACATDAVSNRTTCRRQCDPSIDAGPVGTGITGDHPYCGYADRPETGALILQNCCQFGQTCTVTSVEGQNANVCFGPLPGSAGSTCTPRAATVGTCDPQTALCVEGNAVGPVPNNCVAAGGTNQPCRANSTCSPGNTCIRNAGEAAICRKNCSTTPAACAECGDGFDCVPIVDAMVGAGACVPAANELEACGGPGQLCAGCLVCGGVVGTPNSNACRRPCFADIDAGPANVDSGAIIPAVPPAYCNQPAGSLQILTNCCPLGEVCYRFTEADGGASQFAACYPR